MTLTAYPKLIDLRRTIENYILQIRRSDGRLKPSDEWPGKYILPARHTGSGLIEACNPIPAIFAVGARMVPSDWKIEGIECIIDEVPEITTTGVGSLISIETWPVRFTNYGESHGTTMPTSLLEIHRRVARTFPRDQTTYMPRTEATFEALTARVRGAVLNPTIP